MPPKKQNAPGKKAVEKQKAKIVEDKTFGLKNKNKSKKVQQYVNQVQNAVKFAGQSHKDVKAAEAAKAAREAAKEEKKAMSDEMGSLFNMVVDKSKTAVPLGVDPKTVLCEFFKAGKCVRGNKCKFSHNMDMAQKTAKINVYQDPRQADTMDNWDQNKLEEVVKSKQKGKLPPTDIICKFFLDAIENNQYGWFWECENGNDCHYRHCLPPGYVLKSKVKEQEKEQEDGPTLEEKIDEARRKLDLSKCTPVTLETFKKWKEERAKKKEQEQEEKRKEASKTGGRNLMSGRALFKFDPSLFADDENADDEKYEIDDSYEDEATEENDDTKEMSAPQWKEQEDEEGEENNESQEQPKTKTAPTTTTATTTSGAPAGIDASLFVDDEALPSDDDDD